MNMIIVMEKTQLQDLLRAQTIQLLLLDYDENHIFFLFIKRNIMRFSLSLYYATIPSLAL